MSKKIKLAAIDIGASSGRSIVGEYNGSTIALTETHRFANDPVMVGSTFYWDILRLLFEIKTGLRKSGSDIASIGIDTWGVDYGLLDKNDRLIANPYHHRDARTDGVMELFFEKVSRQRVYDITGIQFMKLNTLFQLFASRLASDVCLENARRLLFTPDLLNFFLTGIKKTEYSIASTSQILDAATRNWSPQLLDVLGITPEFLGEVIPSGTVLGSLLPGVITETGLNTGCKVIATAGHDTASAVAAVPAQGTDFIYISCGTWSLMGIESAMPIINAGSYAHSITNEGGVAGTIRFLKNIMGLWLLQECRRQWEREGTTYSFEELTKMSTQATPLEQFIDPDADEFVAPGDMPGRIRDYCRRTGQTVPQSVADVVRCILQSLALKYRNTVEKIQAITGKTFPHIHMVGGGIQNKLLCQFTADASGREVVAGPVEATALGNILVQLRALGEVGSLDQMRSIVRASTPLISYVPQAGAHWDEAYGRFGKSIN